jgi:hypothetical protein
LNSDKAAEKEDRFQHPGGWESVVPIWGSGKEALADFEDGDYLGAAGNGVLAASDVFLAKAILTGLIKGGAKVGGTYVWRNPVWKEENMRQWLGRRGFVKPNQHAHHGIIPQKAPVPDWIKNQPFNIKPLDAVTHGRVHGRYTVNGQKLPRFKLGQRLWYGTPGWTKPATASSAGHALTATDRAVDEAQAESHERRGPRP